MVSISNSRLTFIPTLIIPFIPRPDRFFLHIPLIFFGFSFAILCTPFGFSLSLFSVFCSPLFKTRFDLGFDKIKDHSATLASSVYVIGKLVDSPGKGQRVELRAIELRLLGPSDAASYPLANKEYCLVLTTHRLRYRVLKNSAVHCFYSIRSSRLRRDYSCLIFWIDTPSSFCALSATSVLALS
jgi:hypothetical protein